MIKAVVFDNFGVLTLSVIDRPKGLFVKNTELLEYIAQLRSRGLKIGLLSNLISNWVREKLLTVEEQELFDEMIFSYEVGIMKPDPRIFMLTCERLRVGPHEVIMVDDTERHLQVAKLEGWNTILYQDINQMKTEINKLLT